MHAYSGYDVVCTQQSGVTIQRNARNVRNATHVTDVVRDWRTGRNDRRRKRPPLWHSVVHKSVLA